jgi:hypothetical protein
MKQRIILCVILIGIAEHALACKCASDPRPIKEEFRDSELVIYGKVISKKSVTPSKTIKESEISEVRRRLKNDKQKLTFFDTDYIFEVKIKVIEGFKRANLGDTVTIYTAITSASCGYAFETDKFYIVYALGKCYLDFAFLPESDRNKNLEKENTYWTTHCSRTTGYTKQEADELRTLKK